MDESPLESIDKKPIIKRVFFEVTPFSKYVTMMVFVVAPFLGAWIGYNFAPTKILFLEEPVLVEKIVEVEKQVIGTTQIGLPGEDTFFWDEETGFSFVYPDILTLTQYGPDSISLELERYQEYRIEEMAVPKDCGTFSPSADELFMNILDRDFTGPEIETLPELREGAFPVVRHELSKGEMCYLTTTYYWQKPDLTYIKILVSPEESIFREMAEEIIVSFEYIEE